MSTHVKILENGKVYFVTFTCYNWLPLIDKSDTYDYIYKWFKYLNNNRCKVLGFVVMPNHFHGIFYLEYNCVATINQIISNGKRFWAYEIIRGLKEKNESKILGFLRESLTGFEVDAGNQHKVFKTSFDCKSCFNREMVQVKLDYMHHNPIKGKWNLISDYRNYEYSSAIFYELNKDREFLTHYMDVI